mgnify:CR=1 FL=1
MKETNNYFSATDRVNNVVEINAAKIPKGMTIDDYIKEFIHKPADSCISMNRKNHGGKGILEQVEYCNTDSSLKDKLKTTPDRGIKKISKIFRVDWSKVFKIK